MLLIFYQAFVAFERMDEMLSMDEMKVYFRKPDDEKTAVGFNNFSAAWDIVERGEVKKRKYQCSIKSLV